MKTSARKQERLSKEISGWELNVLMADFEKLLQSVQLRAVPLDSAVEQKDPEGMVVSFNHVFRTKNINMPGLGESFETLFTGDLKKDPHIYCKIGNNKVVARIDNRWITTTTAFVEFRPSGGLNTFAGLGFVNSFDRQKKHNEHHSLRDGFAFEPGYGVVL
jgi:hypothetical protein